MTVPDPTSEGPSVSTEADALNRPVVGRRTARGQILSYGDGRICTEPQCPTRLSRYNATNRCASHDRQASRSESWRG